MGGNGAARGVSVRIHSLQSNYGVTFDLKICLHFQTRIEMQCSQHSQKLQKKIGHTHKHSHTAPRLTKSEPLVSVISLLTKHLLSLMKITIIQTKQQKPDDR